MSELIIQIPNYITHVQLAKSRRARYYTREWVEKKNLPKKYQNRKLYGFNKEGILISKLTGEKVIANPKTVGTPRLKKINGQDFYSGGNVPIQRYQMVNAIKEYFREEIRKALKDAPIKKIPQHWFPIQMELSFYLPEPKQLFDVDNNSWIYNKVILDSLVDVGVIPNDTCDLVRKAGGGEYCFIPEDVQRRLIIRLSPYQHTPIGEEPAVEKIEF